MMALEFIKIFFSYFFWLYLIFHRQNTMILADEESQSQNQEKEKDTVKSTEKHWMRYFYL